MIPSLKQRVKTLAGARLTSLYHRVRTRLRTMSFEEAMKRWEVPPGCPSGPSGEDAVRLKISILCCAFNTRPDDLRETVESVLAQTYANWELCVNDCGDDAHPEPRAYLEKIAREEPRVRVFRSANLGIARNTDAAARTATGEYLLLLDHDDLLAPAALARLAARAVADNADFVYAEEFNLFMQHGKRCSLYRKRPFAWSLLETSNFINHPVLIRKTLFDAAGGFREGFEGSQDYDLYLRLLERTDAVSFIPEPLYAWRIDEGSFSHRHLGVCEDSGRRALDGHFARRGVRAAAESTETPGVYRTVPMPELAKPILAHVHVFYPERWPELAEMLGHLAPYPHRICITVPKDAPFVHDGTPALDPPPPAGAEVVFTENAGYDIGPFLEALRRVRLEDFSFVLKLHTKRDTPEARLTVNGADYGGARFREYLLSVARTPAALARALTELTTCPDVGMVADPRLLIHSLTDDYDKEATRRLRKFLKERGLPPRRFAYVAGTMFLARAEVFRPLLGLGLRNEDFEPAGTHVGNLAHVLERLIGYFVAARGLRVAAPGVSALGQRLAWTTIFLRKKFRRRHLFSRPTK